MLKTHNSYYATGGDSLKDDHLLEALLYLLWTETRSTNDLLAALVSERNPERGKEAEETLKRARESAFEKAGELALDITKETAERIKMALMPYHG